MIRHIDAPPADVRWNYSIPADRSAKMLLLTTGNICVPGVWSGAYGQYFIAHCPMPKRDKTEERRLGILP